MKLLFDCEVLSTEDCKGQSGWSRTIICLLFPLQTPKALHLPTISSSNVRRTEHWALWFSTQSWNRFGLFWSNDDQVVSPAWTPPGRRGDRCSVWSRFRSLFYSWLLSEHRRHLRSLVLVVFSVFFFFLLYSGSYFSFLLTVDWSWFCFVERPAGRVGECLWWFG